jgi:inorganic pyrophosphatase/exopolyphosphatase
LLRAEPQATIASRTDHLMQNRQRNVGQSKLSKIIFVATNASRENNKVRASERRQPLTVEQMSAEQERYGNQTSDVQIHVWQRIRFAR